MAKAFTPEQWKKIHNLTDSNGEDYGLPKRRQKSVLLASFNIRKLGNVRSKSAPSWEMLTKICSRFDLVAIQEVQDTLDGIRHLKSLLGEEYGLVVSDTTGKYPGSKSMAERLAFLFRWKRVRRTEVASDITYDRTKVSNTLFENRHDFWRAFEDHHAERAVTQAENKKRKKAGKKAKTMPAVPNPHFLTFIRQPLCVSFEIPGKKSAKPYQFLAVNCHLLFGTDKKERRREFNALVAWLLERAKNQKLMYYPNLLLMGDCNLEFKKPKTEKPNIDKFIMSLNKSKLKGRGNAELNFPFLDVHPSQSDVFRTAARLRDTYDQIAIIFRDRRLPNYKKNKNAGDPAKPDGFDFGVFNFSDLVANALHNKDYNDLSKKDKKKLIAHFEHDLSDHMPLWIRLPLPA